MVKSFVTIFAENFVKTPSIMAVWAELSNRNFSTTSIQYMYKPTNNLQNVLYLHYRQYIPTYIYQAPCLYLAGVWGRVRQVPALPSPHQTATDDDGRTEGAEVLQDQEEQPHHSQEI